MNVKELQNGFTLIFLDTLTDKKMLNQDVLSRLEDAQASPNEALKHITVSSTAKHKYVEDVVDSILHGAVVVHSPGHSVIISAIVGPRKTDH